MHSQLSNNMDEIVKLFETRMNQFDKTLAQTQGASKTSTTNTFGDLSALAADYINFKELMWKTLSLLRQQLQLLSSGFDMQEARSRNNILLFHGLQETNDEQVECKVKSTLTQMQLSNIDISNIDVCHRLGVKKEKPRPILVRFTTIKYKNLVWNAKTLLKGSGITVSEFLTKPRQELFYTARKHFGIKSCWTSDGAIILALPDKSRKKIVAHSELQILLDKYPHGISSTQEQKSRSRRPVKVLPK